MPQYNRKLKKGSRWYYKFSFMKKTYFSKAIFHTKQEAQKAERKRYNELETKASKVSANDDMKLLDLINERLDYLKAAKTEKYYKENRSYFNIMFHYFGDIEVKKITRGDIQKLLIEQSKLKRKNNKDNYAVNALLRILKALFFHGINFFELDIKNPCVGVSLYPISKKIKYIPTDEEINQILKKCNPGQRSLIEFVRDTGCRISEALKLRRSDVFDGYVVLYTRKSKSGNLMPREAKYETEKLLLSENQGDRIFSDWTDRPKYLSKKTERKWDWHNLRHRYASQLSKRGIPLFEIMILLGHSNLETTQRYLQLLL